MENIFNLTNFLIFFAIFQTRDNQLPETHKEFVVGQLIVWWSSAQAAAQFKILPGDVKQILIACEIDSAEKLQDLLDEEALEALIIVITEKQVHKTFLIDIK